MQEELYEYLIGGGILFLSGLLTLGIARYASFFKTLKNYGLEKNLYKRVKFHHVIVIFSLGFVVKKFSLKLLSMLFPILKDDPLIEEWVSLGIVVCLFVFVICYLKKEKLTGLLFNTKKYIRTGFLTFFLAVPWVFLSALIAKLLVEEIFGGRGFQQTNYENLQRISEMSIFFASSLTIVVLIPFIEEVMFRGVFQNYIMKKFNKNVSLIITPIFFCLAHFQISSGISNLEFFIPSVVLSFFLSFLYYKTGSLFASTALHMSFNFLSVFALILEKIP